MKILPSDYTINKYGLFARLVEESDAQFIIDLRCSDHAKYMNTIPNDLNKQIDWIRKYKERERQGLDYYFVFYKDDHPLGLYRIYDIRGEVFSSGSWVFTKDSPIGAAFIAQVICREIAFDDLGLEKEEVATAVHVDNTNVLRYNLYMGMKDIGRAMTEKGEYISLGLTKADFNKYKGRALKMAKF
jgi:hypothetical protein